MAGKAGQRRQYGEDSQEERISQLEAAQAQQQQPPPPPPQAPAASGGDDMVSKLKQLADLKSSGVLTQEEFDAAKAKLLAS
jgi:hypothetical protein